MFKKISVVLVAASALLLGSCAQKPADIYTGQTLKVWSFTDELQEFIDRFKAAHPGLKVEYTIVPNEQYLAKLKPVLRSGVDAPDVFTGEAGFVKDLVDNHLWANLSKAPFNVDTSDVFPYVAQVGTDAEGNVRGLSYQATPGAYFFKRDIAKKYLGTDDPAAISKMLATWDDVVKVGEKLKKESNGKVFLISSIADLFNPFYANRQHGWVENGQFYYDDVLNKAAEIAKKIRTDGLDAKAGQWSPPWFNGMKKNGNVFLYMLPTWGLTYVLEKNAPDASGDWGAASGPASYFWGGTWLGINPKSTQKQLAWEFVKFVTLNHDTLTWWATKSKHAGDFVSSISVVNSLKDTLTSPYLDGQKHYAYFDDQVGKINGNLITPYDQQGNAFYQNAVNDYLDGKLPNVQAVKERVISDFKNAFPDLKY